MSTQLCNRLRLPKGKRQTKAHTRAPGQERQLAKRIGADLVPRSGAGFTKADVRKKRIVRVECKCTTAKSFSVTREMIRKIEDAALAAGEIPVIVVEFLQLDGKAQYEVVIAPRYVLDVLAKG